MKFDPLEFETAEIAGLKVYVKNVPWASGFAYIRVFMGVGAQNDPVGKEGLSHFFEHLPFNGSRSHPSRVEIEKINRSLFLDTLNARTNSESTLFFGKIDSSRLAEALSFLSDLVFHPVLGAEEIERERKVITQEIWDRYSNELDEDLAKKFVKLRYGSHAFGRFQSAIGWHDTVEKITHDDLKDFHARHYHIGNVRLIIVGDVDLGRDGKVIAEFADSCPKGVPLALPKPLASWPNPVPAEYEMSMSEYFGLTGKSISKSATISVYRNIPLVENEDVLWIGSSLIRQLLYERIRGELGAAYTPSVNFGVNNDFVSFAASVETSGELADQIRKLMADVIGEVLRADARHEPLFDELKTAHIDGIRLGDYSAYNIAQEAVGMLNDIQRIITKEAQLKDAEKATYADLAALFKKEFNPEQLFWYIQRP